jgi:hypothetical protein
VRNHVLARWRHDPSKYLSEDGAASRIQTRFRPMITAAWQFLDT